MHTKVLSFSNPHALAEAESILNHDGVIAAPTDTVYGVFCRYDSPRAIEQLYVAKSRPPHKAIPVLIGEEKQIHSIAKFPIPDLAINLMHNFWPGPLTLVLPALPTLPPILTAGQSTVAVRMPDHDALRGLIRRTGPLAATSANISGGPESVSSADVAAQLGGKIPLILQGDLEESITLDTDSGGETNTGNGRSSTIVDVSDFRAKGAILLRAGPIAQEVMQLLTQFGQPAQ